MNSDLTVGKPDTAIQTGIDYLRILASFYPVVSVKLIADGILRESEMMSSIFGEN